MVKENQKGNGQELVEMHLFAFRNERCLQKPDLHPKLFFSKRPWSSNMPLICALQGKNFLCKERLQTHRL
jgi:hypothetical protein